MGGAGAAMSGQSIIVGVAQGGATGAPGRWPGPASRRWWASSPAAAWRSTPTASARTWRKDVVGQVVGYAMGTQDGFSFGQLLGSAAGGALFAKLGRPSLNCNATGPLSGWLGMTGLGAVTGRWATRCRRDTTT